MGGRNSWVKRGWKKGTRKTGGVESRGKGGKRPVRGKKKEGAPI